MQLFENKQQFGSCWMEPAYKINLIYIMTFITPDIDIRTNYAREGYLIRTGSIDQQYMNDGNWPFNSQKWLACNFSL